jgi:protein tyrosine/serine phosphatase
MAQKQKQYQADDDTDATRAAWKSLFLYMGLFLLACSLYWLWGAYHATYHFGIVQPGVLYRSGNNSLRRLTYTLDRGKIHTVVALIDDKEFADPTKPQFAQEQEYLASHGIKYYRLPVKLGGWPSSDQIQQFLHIATDPANQPVLVHCAQGVRRTGMFVAAFEESQLGWKRMQTKASIQPYGHGPSTVQNIETFIDRYDPKAETFSSADLGKGSED